MSKRLWVVFYLLNWQELAAYTLEGTFASECIETRRLLAYEHGVREEDISVAIEQRIDVAEDSCPLSSHRSSYNRH